MTRFARAGLAGLALAIAASAVLAGAAAATIYRGSGLDDAEMPVKIKLTGRDLIFDYTDILVGCSDGSEPRQGGASHADVINEHGRFKDKIEIGGATSVVKGKVKRNKASGTITYDLRYDGGECHSGQVEWKAKRNQRRGSTGRSQACGLHSLADALRARLLERPRARQTLVGRDHDGGARAPPTHPHGRG